MEIPEIVRNTVRDIGYTDPEYGFEYKSCGVMVSINKQSPDIDLGVSKAKEAKEATAAMMNWIRPEPETRE